MASLTGAIRKLVLAPELREVSFAVRGFPVQPSAVTRSLEAIPQAVICGFDWGIEHRRNEEVESRLAMVEPNLRGFAYEGATMAYTIRDALSGGRGRRTGELLRGSGRQHIFLGYIGIGFAMARLPRPLWKRVLPELAGPQYYPAMHWLAVDGYGFDRAFFDTRRWVDQQRVPEPYPWCGSPEYFLRAVDQGIGRALWFIHGASVPAVLDAVHRFAPQRQPDLFSGVGLAATYAGGCTRPDLATLGRGAGDLRGDLAQGSVFAAKAREYSGFVPPHTEVATSALASLTVAEATALADAAEASSDSGSARVPRYERWRQEVRAGFRPAELPR